MDGIILPKPHPERAIAWSAVLAEQQQREYVTHV